MLVLDKKLPAIVVTHSVAAFCGARLWENSSVLQNFIEPETLHRISIFSCIFFLQLFCDNRSFTQYTPTVPRLSYRLSLILSSFVSVYRPISVILSDIDQASFDFLAIADDCKNLDLSDISTDDDAPLHCDDIPLDCAVPIPLQLDTHSVDRANDNNDNMPVTDLVSNEVLDGSDSQDKSEQYDSSCDISMVCIVNLSDHRNTNVYLDQSFGGDMSHENLLDGADRGRDIQMEFFVLSCCIIALLSDELASTASTDSTASASTASIVSTPANAPVLTDDCISDASVYETAEDHATETASIHELEQHSASHQNADFEQNDDIVQGASRSSVPNLLDESPVCSSPSECESVSTANSMNAPKHAVTIEDVTDPEFEQLRLAYLDTNVSQLLASSSSSPATDSSVVTPASSAVRTSLTVLTDFAEVGDIGVIPTSTNSDTSNMLYESDVDDAQTGLTYEQQADSDFYAKMAEAYHLIKKDAGLWSELPTNTPDEQVLFNIYVIKTLINKTIQFTDQLSTCRGATVEDYIGGMDANVGKDPMRLLVYYCYYLAFKFADIPSDELFYCYENNKELQQKMKASHEQEMAERFNQTLRLTMPDDNGNKQPPLLDQMFRSYIACTQSTHPSIAEFCTQYDDGLLQIFYDGLGEMAIDECDAYLTRLTEQIRSNEPCDLKPLNEIVELYRPLMNFFQKQVTEYERITTDLDNYSSFLDWVQTHDCATQHEHCATVLKELGVWSEKIFHADLKKLRSLHRPYLSKRERISNRFFRLRNH